MSATDCLELFSALDARRSCERSNFGTKILTQCLYPSASPVFVHVGMWGDEFRVSDGGEAAQCALFHGRDEWAVEAGLKAASSRFSLEIENGELVALAPNRDWLPNVVAAVANGAAHAASVAVDHALRQREKSLIERIGEHLHGVVDEKRIAKGYDYRGRSGKMWTVDFAITGTRPILIKAVTPHHNSIASTYTTFSDLAADENRRFSVYSRRPNNDDAALLRQVAELVPLSGLGGGVLAAVGH